MAEKFLDVFCGIKHPSSCHTH